MGDWIPGIKVKPECRGSQRCTLPQASYHNEPECSHILRRHDLLQTSFNVCPGSNQTASDIRNFGGGVTPDYYCSFRECEQTGVDIIRKDKDCITLITKVFGFLSKGNLTK